VARTWRDEIRDGFRLLCVVEDKQPAGTWLASTECVKRCLGNARSRRPSPFQSTPPGSMPYDISGR
jgi:hypothetical protein